MAIELIAKIKQKNNGIFKLVDACDVEMKDGQDLQTCIDNLEISGSGFVLELNEEPTTDYMLSVNTDEVANAYNSVYENLYLQFQTLFKEMQNTIDRQQERIDDLEARVFALESGSVKPPTTYKDVIMDYNNEPLLDYNGKPIEEYKEAPIVEYDCIVDYNNEPLLDYNGNIMNDYNVTLKEENVVDYNGGALEDYSGGVFTDYGKIIYLMDYKEGYITDYNENKIFIKEGVV